MRDLPPAFGAQRPMLALAPMQDVTDLAFWRVLMRYGGPDLLFTEYFRVHPTSTLESWILRSIVENTTGRPVIAQMIGNDIPSLVRTARELEQYPIAGIDLNLGCPAPVVYRKCAGGGLLREPERIHAILEALADATRLPFTVKTRVGFESVEEFDRLLPLFARHPLSLLTVHGRTVREMYGPVVHVDLIGRAVREAGCPVLANGGVDSASKAVETLRSSGACGLMIGRGAIRNPWLFRQIREELAGQPVFMPTGRDVLGYFRELYEAVRPPGIRADKHVQKMKKYLNFLGAGVEDPAAFLFAMRRAPTESALFALCAQHLDHDRPMPLRDGGQQEQAPAAC